MTIRLPDDLERRVEAAVRSGRFASLDDAMAEAARLLLRQLDPDGPREPDPDPILGLMRDDAPLMDQIVADAYRHRRDEPWREADL